jgi:hypothetical protein
MKDIGETYAYVSLPQKLNLTASQIPEIWNSLNGLRPADVYQKHDVECMGAGNGVLSTTQCRKVIILCEQLSSNICRRELLELRGPLEGCTVNRWDKSSQWKAEC